MNVFTATQGCTSCGKVWLFTLLICIIPNLTISENGSKKGKVTLDSLTDVKDFKKLIKTKTNVLVCFGNGRASFLKDGVVNILTESANQVKGLGTVAVADCSSAETKKKLCKKLKVSPNEGEYILKHYNNGDFNKDYDRAVKVSSVVNFMRDPTGDLPWDEDVTSKDITHLPDTSALNKLLKKEMSTGRGILVMFYAPWCGFCKRMKPDYAVAATEVKNEDTGILAAMDVNKPENGVVRQRFNISGFPTLLYFKNGQMRQQYEGENNKEAIISFMKDPNARPAEKPKEPEWADEPSEVIHLTSETFESTLKENPSVLIMFYAPWCGHCKRMKPNYVAAAARLKKEGISGVLAALDATKENEIAKRFDVQGYPTVKYFKDGELAFDVGNVREENEIVNFMKDPTEPPPPPPPEKAWSEEESAVVHLTDESFKSTLRKKKRALIMFYAPWCGHCKAAKPEFTQAAEDLKDDPKVLFGAVDCTVQRTICETYDVKGYPTFKIFHYFNKEDVQSFDGARTKNGFLEEMQPSMAPAPGTDWSDIPGSEHVVMLTDSTFSSFVENQDSALVMFYTAWCGHCKSSKPQFAEAAKLLATKDSSAAMAALDCVKYKKIPEKQGISGYPTFQYYKNGKLIGEYNQSRRASDFVRFMLKKPNKDEL